MLMVYFLHFAKSVCGDLDLQRLGSAHSRHFYRLGGGFSFYPFYPSNWCAFGNPNPLLPLRSLSGGSWGSEA